MLWRVSVADIATDGPFSLFPGFDRQTALLAGVGFRLGALTVTAADPWASYSGDTPLECVLLDSPVRVLNVLAQRGSVWPQMARVRGESTVGMAGRETLALCAEGEAVCGGVALRCYDSVRFEGELPVAGTGSLLTVSL